MALIYVDGEWIDDGAGSAPAPQQQNQGPTYQDGEWLGAGSYAPPSNLYVPDQGASFDYNPETPFNPNDYQQQQQPQYNPFDFNSWFEQPQPSYPDYAHQDETELPPNLSIPSFDYNPETQFTPPNLSVPDELKSDGSVSSMYEQESLQPDYLRGANGSSLYPMDRAYYSKQNDTGQGSGASWGKLDNQAYANTFGQVANTLNTLGSNEGSVSDFYQTESTPRDPHPYVPYWEQEMNKPPLPYQEGYDPQVGSVLDPSKLFDRASAETNKNWELPSPDQVALGALGFIPSVGYNVLNSAATSDIPGVNVASGIVRNYVNQALKPFFNIFTSEIGDIARGDTNTPLVGPFTNKWDNKQTQLEKAGQAISSTWDPQQAQQFQEQLTQKGNVYYQNQLAQGKSPEEAQKNLKTYLETEANPLNYAQSAGVQTFSEFPAWAQLAIGLADPVSNAASKGLMERYAAPITRQIGKAVNATGLPEVVKALDEKLLQAPKQKEYKANLQAEMVFNALEDVATKFEIPQPDLARSFLKDPESPLYYQNWLTDPAKLAVAQKWEQLYDSAPMAKLSNPDTAITGGKIAPTESEFGQNVQNTSGQPAASLNKPIEYKPAEPGTVDPAITAANAASDIDFANIKTATPAAEPPKLPDNYAGIKIPDKTADLSDWFGAVKTAQGVDAGALKLDKTLDKPGYRAAKPLEEWGIIGSALRGANSFTQATVARPFLNTFSRGVIRDPLSNESKLLVTRPHLIGEQVKGLFGKSQINANAEKLYGKAPTLGPSSITADVGTQGAKKVNPIAELYYVAANPLNEVPAKILNKATGGKFKDWSTYSENREANVKQLYLNDVRLELGKQEVKQLMDSKFYEQYPELKGIPPADIEKALLNRHFGGFDLDAAKKAEYVPGNTSPEYDARWEKVLGGKAGLYGNIVYDAASSIPTRVIAENDTRVLNYLKDSGYRLPKSLDLKDVNPKALANARANTKQIRLEDVKPGHEIYDQMVNDAANALDAAEFSMRPTDPKLLQASIQLAEASLKYAAESGRYDMFRQAIKDRTAAKEVEYAQKFNGQKQPRTVKPKPVNPAQAKLPEPNALAALKQEVFEYRKIPGRTIPAANVLKTIRGDGKPGDVVVRYQKDGATHFRSTAPDKLRDGETIAWPIEQTPQPTTRLATKEERAALTQSKVLPIKQIDNAEFANGVGNPPPIRMNVGNKNGHAVNGQVLTPDAMQKIASTFNRAEKTNKYGDVITAPPSRAQMNRYLNDMLATDQYYRKISNNTFKLDPDYLVPVRISDGVTLNEIMGQPLPKRIGPDVTSFKDLPVEDLGEALKERYGEDVYKQDFSTMDPALRDTILREISTEYFGVDPLNPVAKPKASAEHEAAIEALKDLGVDMQQRYDATAKTKADLADRETKYGLDVKKVTDTMAAQQANIAVKVNDAAYKSNKSVFFDYRDKNRLDQALGSILPFAYWGRQNFAYLARHFAKNPYHFAAVLNFYQEMEKENSDPSIPGYQKSTIGFLKLPGGENVTITPSSYLPINPLGSDDLFGGFAIMTDDELAASNTKLANKEPLAILFGQDKTSQFIDPKTGKPKVTGRDKGFVPSYLSPNPFFVDLMLETGIVNKWWEKAGVAKGNQTTLGQDYPEDTRAQHANLSFFPGSRIYPQVAAATPLGGAFRDAGIVKGEFNPLQPLNEMVYGKNAGKPATAFYQEINRMVANGEIKAEEGKLAIAAFKDGSYNSKPLLVAMDRVYADTLPQKMASAVGLSTMLSNTPRQQITNKLYGEQSAAYAKDDAALPGYSLDDKGYANKNDSAVSAYYDKNPAASVLATEQANDTPESIRAGVLNDKTYKAIDKLKAQRKDGTIDYSTYKSELDKLQGANPDFFDKNNYYKTTPGEAKYQAQLDQYKSIGGEYFDRLTEGLQEAKASGDDEGYKKILSSPEYKAAADQRLQFMLSNPDFQKKYAANNDQFARERTQELVGGVGRSNPQLAPKPQKTVEDLQYQKTTNQYYDVGGDRFDKLQTQAYAAKDKGDDATYKKIVSSEEYQTAQQKRNDFIFDNPEWYKQYSDNSVAGGGTNKNQGPLPPREMARFTPKPPKAIDQIKQDQITSKYYAIGGDDFDTLQKKAYDAKDNGDDATFTRILASPEYQAAQKKRNDFIIDNEDWYNKYSKSISDKNAGGATNATLRGGTTPQIIPGGTLGRPKTIPDIKYGQSLSEYYAKGGDDFDRMQADIKKYFDADQDNKAYDIINSREYQQVKATQNQFKKDNPDFAKRYDAEYTRSNGKPPKTEVEQIYDEQRAAYYKIGGPGFDATQKKINDLFDAGKDSEAYTLMNDRDYKRITAAQDQFKLDNPDFARKYNADNFAKYGTTPKSDADKVYSELKGQYANVGGAKYDAMAKMVSDYMDAGDKKSAGVILGSAAYKQAKAARDQFLDDNPEFAARYKAENEAKYGPSKTSTSSGSSSGGGSSTVYKNAGGNSYSYSSKKTTTSYKPQAKSGGKSVSNSAPFTKAQTAAYAYARNTLGYDATQAAGYARKVPAAQTSFRTPGSTTTKSVAALPKPTSAGVKPTKTVVDSKNPVTYNQGKSSVKTTPTNTFRNVASLPQPVRSSGGGGGGGSKPKKAPAKAPIHNFLPGPNQSLVRFSKRKRYR